MLRALIVVCVVFGFAFLVGPFCIVYALIRGKPDILYGAGRLGCRLGMKLAGTKLQVRGLEQVEPHRNYLFVANHQSYCDPPALFITIPQNARLILKKELRKLPVVGTVMKLGGFVFIDRKDRGDALAGMNQAVRQLQHGDSFLVYPEGTRTRTGKMGPFKKGPFIMALQAGVPIIPVTVSGSFEIMRPTQFKLTPGTITLTFHSAIETKGLGSNHRDPLMEKVWKTIAMELGESESAFMKASQFGN